jgi:hypothetical protein
MADSCVCEFKHCGRTKCQEASPITVWSLKKVEWMQISFTMSEHLIKFLCSARRTFNGITFELGDITNLYVNDDYGSKYKIIPYDKLASSVNLWVLSNDLTRERSVIYHVSKANGERMVTALDMAVISFHCYSQWSRCTKEQPLISNLVKERDIWMEVAFTMPKEIFEFIESNRNSFFADVLIRPMRSTFFKGKISSKDGRTISPFYKKQNYRAPFDVAMSTWHVRSIDIVEGDAKLFNLPHWIVSEENAQKMIDVLKDVVTQFKASGATFTVAGIHEKNPKYIRLPIPECVKRI